MDELIWSVEKRKLSDLKNWAKNPRKLTEKEFEKLKERITKRGFHDVLKIDVDGTIISGNQRKRALKDLGFDEVEVKFPNRPLTDKERQDVALESNLHDGSWDWDELANGFDEKDLLDIGFEDKDLGKFRVEGEEDDFDADKALEDIKEPITKLGDIYQLGNHRLMCGSATEASDVLGIMGQEKADLLITDPPYNVNYTGKTKDALKIENDNKSDDEFGLFLKNSFLNADMVMKEGGVFYIWHADSEGYNFRKACKDVGWKVRQCLIWHKNSMVMGRQDYHWQHEPCLYGWKDGAGHKWTTDRKQTTILSFDRPSSSKEHPTMKPVVMMNYQISNNTNQGDSVLYLFGGSGSTLMACEQSGRKCFIMELDPKYCDVIVKRWEQFTNKKAVKI